MLIKTSIWYFAVRCRFDLVWNALKRFWKCSVAKTLVHPQLYSNDISGASAKRRHTFYDIDLGIYLSW